MYPTVHSGWCNDYAFSFVYLLLPIFRQVVYKFRYYHVCQQAYICLTSGNGFFYWRSGDNGILSCFFVLAAYISDAIEISWLLG